MRRLLFVSLLILASAAQASADDPFQSSTFVEVHLDTFFAAVEGPGTFIVFDPGRDRLLVHNPDRSKQRFIPASTYKIPNSIIALETGVADGPDFSLPWDSTRVKAGPYWPRSWKRDQTLRTAFQNSVFWYYQEIARRIGEDRMRQYLEKWEYGNRKLTPAIDTFWLYGDIRISPLEQVDFLVRLGNNELGISERTGRILREIMVLEEADTHVLRGKTGTAEVTPTRELGWLVGTVERGESTYYYALNMEGERVWEEWPPQKRKGLVVRLLRALDILPPM